MKKRVLPAIVVLFLFFTMNSCRAQGPASRLNLDFEMAKDQKPLGWEDFGEKNYLLSLDTAAVKSGAYAATIQSLPDHGGYHAWAFTLPGNYAGRKIKLSGYVKTENVSDGFAGLWMRIDPNIAFDNMQQRGIKGTTGWQKYEIVLDMDPAKTKQIVVGGLLAGPGKMWMDDLQVSIDGVPLERLKPLEKKIVPAEEDKAFDNGSQITAITPDKKQIANLKVLGLIWGFLKYRHPAIARGSWNWDYELFRILPKILNMSNQPERDVLLTSWIRNLGPIAAPGESKKESTFVVKLEPDLAWIQDAHFSPELTSLLTAISHLDAPEENYYLGFAPTGNADFKNERAYSSNPFPDAGYRLLTLYRYWNMIQYYFPYKQLIGEDWKNVLEEFIPKFMSNRDTTEYTLTTLELIARVHDTHANIWGNNVRLNAYRGARYAPVEITFVEDQPVVTGYYDNELGKKTGLQRGDRIVAVNGRPVKKMVEEQLKYRPASNYPTQLRDISADFLRTNDSVLHVAFKRDGKTKDLVLKTYNTKEINIYAKYERKDTSFRLIHKDIAYLNNGSIKKADLPEIWKAIAPTKGLIIDNRNYPSDFVIYDLGAYLMPGARPFVKITRGNRANPGQFCFEKTLDIGMNNPNYYKGRVVILVNETSQSSSEFHAMGYRTHPNAIVIGSTTAGADGNVSRFQLPGGISSMISGIGIYYPDGGETQRVGIVPDIVVKPTIRGIKENRDEVLEKAIELINKE